MAKQIEFISRHSRVFSGFDSPDKSSRTEQNLRLSQAEKAIDMSNGRIPIIPPAVIARQVDTSDILPDEIQTMLGVYHSPFVDPATKARVHQRLRHAYADHISQREALAQAEESTRTTQKEAEFKAYLDKYMQGLATK